MAEQTRTYSGPLARGRVTLPTRDAAFQRGVPITVDADEAKFLDADAEWAAKPDKPKPPKANPAETQEP